MAAGQCGCMKTRHLMIWRVDGINSNYKLLLKLEDTARYAGLLLAPAEGFGLPPRIFFCSLGKRKEFIMLFWPILGNFWCAVVTFVTFSSNLSNFERNPSPKKNLKKKRKKINHPPSKKKEKKEKKNLHQKRSKNPYKKFRKMSKMVKKNKKSQKFTFFQKMLSS